MVNQLSTNRHHQVVPSECSLCSPRSPSSRARGHAPGPLTSPSLSPRTQLRAGLRDDVARARLAAVAITLSTRVRTQWAAMAGWWFIADAAALTFSASSVIRAQAPCRDISSSGRDGGARRQDARGQTAVEQGRFPRGRHVPPGDFFFFFF